MIIGHFARGRISAQRPAEQQDKGLRLMDFIVDPASRLLDTEGAPFLLQKESTAGHGSVDGLGQEDVAVLELVILILLAVLDLVGEVRHLISVVRS